MILSPSKTKDVVKDELSRWETFPAVHFICVFFNKSVNLLAWWNKSLRMTFSLKLSGCDLVTELVNVCFCVCACLHLYLCVTKEYPRGRGCDKVTLWPSCELVFELVRVCLRVYLCVTKV